MPYFFATWGEWIDAIDISRGISLADRSSSFVKVFSVQNSVSNKNAANVSDCKYISLSLDSINDMH